MNLQKYDLKPIWRTLTADVVDICEGDDVAASIIDYFESQTLRKVEERTQGARSDDWIEFSVNYAQRILVSYRSPQTIDKSLRRLVRLELLQPHPANSQRSGRASRFRLNFRKLNQLKDAWLEEKAELAQTGIIDRVWIVPHGEAPLQNQRPEPKVIRFGEEVSKYGDPTSPNMERIPLQNHGQESVKEEDSESTTTATTEAASGLSLSLSIDSNLQKKAQAALHDFTGKRPTTAQVKQLVGLWNKYGEAAVADAITIAAAQDKTTLRYVEGILHNRATEQHISTPTERKYFTAPPADTPMAPEEVARIKAMVAEARANLKNPEMPTAERLKGDGS